MSQRNLWTPFLLLCVLASAGCGVPQNTIQAATSSSSGLSYAGTWVTATAYTTGQVVQYNGSSYVALTGNTGVAPAGVAQSLVTWGLLAQQGSPGSTGVQGVAGAIGPQGVPGAQGVAGPPGAVGAVGATGATGANGTSISYSGVWQSAQAYTTGQVVQYSGSSYVALTGNTGVTPAGAAQSLVYWGLLAQQGTTGAVGPQGVAGVAGAIGPQGVQGLQGMQGPQGTPGLAGPQGTPGVAGPQGTPGVAGPQGTPGVVGPQGATGAVGTAGAAGADGTSITYAGAWRSGQSYVLGQVVQYNGSSYVALVTSVGLPPTAGQSTNYWGVVALEGGQGVAGPQGATGVQGLAGLQGNTGPAGPSGAQGLQGLQGPAGTGTSFLASRRFGVQGDSISAIFEQAWQNVVISRTGMTQSYQDARPGRTMAQAFECYGAASPGTPLGSWNNSDGLGYCTGMGTPGSTLTQNLANVDLLVIELGTNGEGEALGSLGDGYTAGTWYGDMRWVVETLLNTKPTMRVVLVTPQFNGLADSSTTQQYAQAMVDYGSSIGIPVINMYALGGVNGITNAVLLRDDIHPSDFAFANFYGPVIAQGLAKVF